MTLYTCFGDIENTTWRSWLGGVETKRLDCDSACSDEGGLGDKDEGSLEDDDDEGLGDDSEAVLLEWRRAEFRW